MKSDLVGCPACDKGGGGGGVGGGGQQQQQQAVVTNGGQMQLANGEPTTQNASTVSAEDLGNSSSSCMHTKMSTDLASSGYTE